jgi:hypothetical protein
VDLRDVRIIKKLGDTVDATEFVEGLVFDQKATKSAGGPTKVKGAKIALIQFCVSPPKTDLENNVVLSGPYKPLMHLIHLNLRPREQRRPQLSVRALDALSSLNALPTILFYLTTDPYQR